MYTCYYHVIFEPIRKHVGWNTSKDAWLNLVPLAARCSMTTAAEVGDPLPFVIADHLSSPDLYGFCTDLRVLQPVAEDLRDVPSLTSGKKKVGQCWTLEGVLPRQVSPIIHFLNVVKLSTHRTRPPVCLCVLKTHTGSLFWGWIHGWNSINWFSFRRKTFLSWVVFWYLDKTNRKVMIYDLFHVTGGSCS